ACRRLYPCADGWLCVAATTAAEIAGLGRFAGTPVAADDPPDGAHAAAIARRLEPEARATALATLRGFGVPVAPCFGFADLFENPGFRASGPVVEQAHPTLGALQVPGPFLRFDATPIALGRSAPLLGGDGAEVLREIGYADARIAALVDAGVVGR